MKPNRLIVTPCAAFASLVAFGWIGAAAAQPDKPSAKGEHPLRAFIQRAEKSRKTLDKVNDYTAHFIKMEVVRGRKYPHQMLMKFREKPFSVYLYFTDKHKGRQVLYVAGKNSGKLLAKDSGFGAIAGTLALLPESPQAMQEGKFPITKIGLRNLVDAVIDQWKAELKASDVKVTYFPNATLKGNERRLKLKPMECVVLESRRTRMTPGTEYAVTRLYIDRKSGLPVRVEQYGFARGGRKPPLLAEYTYWNLQTNVGLKDIDFNPKNPRYKL